VQFLETGGAKIFMILPNRLSSDGLSSYLELIMSDVTLSAIHVILPVTGPYTAKDQAKSDKANKFIGRGSQRSSTERYRKAWGCRANCGSYQNTDVVFISAEGNRAGAHEPDFEEIGRAVSAGACLITDDKANRLRAYNTGERNVADYLGRNGYNEHPSGVWSKPPENVEFTDPTATIRMAVES
jgi:hypothetical protein